MSDDPVADALSLFEDVTNVVSETIVESVGAPGAPSPRERFLSGLFSKWASIADGRAPDAPSLKAHVRIGADVARGAMSAFDEALAARDDPA